MLLHVWMAILIAGCVLCLLRIIWIRWRSKTTSASIIVTARCCQTSTHSKWLRWWRPVFTNLTAGHVTFGWLSGNLETEQPWTNADTEQCIYNTVFCKNVFSLWVISRDITVDLKHILYLIALDGRIKGWFSHCYFTSRLLSLKLLLTHCVMHYLMCNAFQWHLLGYG